MNIFQSWVSYIIWAKRVSDMTEFHRQAFKKQIEAKPTHYSSIPLIEKCSTRYDSTTCGFSVSNIILLYSISAQVFLHTTFTMTKCLSEEPHHPSSAMSEPISARHSTLSKWHQSAPAFWTELVLKYGKFSYIKSWIM